jgi:hypothetical protein
MMTSVWMCLAAMAAGAAAGAASGVRLGGAAMGNQTAALMGGLFSLSAVVPAALIAALIHGLR